MRLYSNMIKLIKFHCDRKYCGRSQAIAGVITDHHSSQNSLMAGISSLDTIFCTSAKHHYDELMTSHLKSFLDLALFFNVLHYESAYNMISSS